MIWAPEVGVNGSAGLCAADGAGCVIEGGSAAVRVGSYDADSRMMTVVTPAELTWARL